MDYETLKFSERNGLAIIKFNRGDLRNSLNTQMRAEITYAVKAAGKSARCIVLTGAGEAFCSGQDLGDRSNAANLDLERTLRDEYLPMLDAITHCPVPTLAAVNGAASGAGANLALACDVVVASERATFTQAFTRIGLIPDAGSTYFMPRQMGMAKAMGAAFFAEKITARQACDWGMIWEAVPDTDFAAHWMARATHLATGPTRAFGNIKTAIRSSYDNSMEDQLALEARLQGDCGKTRDFREGMMAFIEKRPAQYEGR